MLRVGGNRFDVGRLDDEIGGEVRGVMAIGAVAAEEVAGRGRVTARDAKPPRCAERQGNNGRETDVVTPHANLSYAFSIQ